MIEIKEETLKQIQWRGNNLTFSDEMIQQILQDHENAKFDYKGRSHDFEKLYNESCELRKKDRQIVKRLEERIEWVRKELEKTTTIEQSSNFQWLLQHFISILELQSFPWGEK